MPPTLHKLPYYERQLDAYHHAFEEELENIINELPIRHGDRVLDMACGSGFYTELLASRVGDRGKVVAVDVNPSYLNATRNRAKATPFSHRVVCERGNIERLPFEDGAFDAVWCAQSLYSLPDPVKTLRELKRVVRPRGIVAVLENDLLHQVLLPWPPGFEIRIRYAEYQALKSEKRGTSKFYLPRRLSAIFAEAGLIPDRKETYAHTRHAPLGKHTRDFLKLYIDQLKKDTRAYLSLHDKKLMDALCSENSKEYLLNNPFFSMTCLDTVLCGMRP